MKKFVRFCLIPVVVLLMTVSGVFAQDLLPAGKSWEELRSRPYPQWFTDAKLGIFIHWGVYSVPSYGGAESYAEWYLLGMKSGSPQRLDFVRKNYGENFTYRDFAPLFKAELFDADEWAGIFKEAGARYIVMVTKHHDGYCLWPSKYAPGWNSMDVGPKRDLVGELATAVRKQDIRFGAYYSLPEWDNPLHRWYEDPNDSIGKYVEQHMIPQFKEMVEAYRPDLLFTDGEWYNSAEQWKARQFISWYYDLIGPDAIVNDRWGSGADIGFKTPEYSSGGRSTDRPWAEVRGLGRSFGLNRNEKLSAYMTPAELIHLFARTVAYGGGLIINVGPAADGKIPLLQQERIEQLGHWLKINGEAIYGSTKWIKSGEEKAVTLERIDPKIDFNWVRNSPGYPIVEDHFTAEWNGFIKPSVTGEYSFYAEADDGMKLYIDDKLILDKWEARTEGTDSEAMRSDAKGTKTKGIILEKDKYYPVKIEYHEDVQNASIRLFWESASVPREIIPTANLFTEKGLAQGNGLKGKYDSMRQYMAYTKNHNNLYAIFFEWPGLEAELKLPENVQVSDVSLLGREGSLNFRQVDGVLRINLRDVQFSEILGEYAWTFRIEGTGF